jgi:hypothetical protein
MHIEARELSKVIQTCEEEAGKKELAFALSQTTEGTAAL